VKKRKRTEKSRYKHESTGDHCTCAAYVAEIMCKRNAENKNQGSLPYKFWNRKPWNWTFKRQLYVANKLIKEFGERPVVRAINAPEFKKIFSLNHPSAKKIIKRYKLIVEQEEQRETQEVSFKEQATRRTKSYGKKNALQRLREIENGKKESHEEN
jgi:hypothetical protein